jgi:oligopeptidase A
VDGWRFTLQAPSLLPLMTHAVRRELREEMWRAQHARATEVPYDNRPVLAEIFRKRRQLARHLGYATYADLMLEDRMAGSTERARGFVDDLSARTRPYFEAEMARVATFAREHLGLPELAPWDLRFAFERARRARFDLDEEALRAYMPFDRVEAGVFELARRSFGLTIRPVTGVDVWHPSVRTYEAFAEDGTRLGFFYTDWFPRESKRGGAWMNGLVAGGPRADGGFDPHVGVVVGNMTPASADRPALLTPDEVRTVFHEYGHLFHFLLTRVDVRARGSGAVPWDFIELPSLIMENWTWSAEALSSFTAHFETGAPLPADEVERLLAARRFGEAWTQMRQLSFAAVDLALHVDHDPENGEDAALFARDVMATYEWDPSFAHPGFICGFSHILAGGYAAGYYSYKWSEVLEADAFSRFEAAGVFDEATGRAFVKSVLERGDSVDADAMFRDFMGRDPDAQALVLRNLGPAPATEPT